MKHTNNALDMLLPGSCYTSHIKTLLFGLWSVGFCQSSATDREYLSYSFYATLPLALEVLAVYFFSSDYHVDNHALNFQSPLSCSSH